MNQVSWLCLKTVVAVGVVLIISSCGPVYHTEYTYIPPKNMQGQNCILQCRNIKLQCEQLKESQRDRCEDRAELQYERCQDRNRYVDKDDQRYCYRSYCSAPDYAACESDFRVCYQSCGGQVLSETKCVSNCDKVPPEQR